MSLDGGNEGVGCLTETGGLVFFGRFPFAHFSFLSFSFNKAVLVQNVSCVAFTCVCVCVCLCAFFLFSVLLCFVLHVLVSYGLDYHYAFYH